MTSNAPFDCPCRMIDDIKEPYATCCKPLHADSGFAHDAEALMCSRYSAFVLVLPDYIVKTTLPAQQPLLDKHAIEAWAIDTEWARLDIIQPATIKPTAKLTKRHAQIEFKAFYDTDTGRNAHHELSTFVKSGANGEQEKWYFLDPTVQMSVTQKQPCICGSGIKFKRCCGQFLTS